MQNNGNWVARGENSVELRCSKTGEKYLKMDWVCNWPNKEDVLELGRSQMRTLLFFKHKFADTYVVLVTWLTLDLSRNGKLVTRVARRKYRVNLKSRKITVPRNGQACALSSTSLWDGSNVPRYGVEEVWAKESLEKELLVMTKYAEMLWSGMEKRGTNRVEM